MPLEHFRSVREGKRPPRFFESRVAAPGEQRSLLDRKIEWADRLMDSCDLCPHHCRVNRNRGETGFCGVADKTAVHWEGVLHGEEIEVVPSHEVFLSGCTMRCAFCYSHEHITRPMSGLPMAPSELAACTQARRAQGATNLNLVGGDPIVHVANILKTLRVLDDPIPIVWNSNMYATPQTMALLDGVVDLFLGDVHFGNDACARKLGRIPDYLPSVQAAFVAAAQSGASVVIRHLVMPGHNHCCALPAMEWAARVLPDVPFHLMFQYLPDYRALGDPVLGRPLTAAERDEALALARQVGVRLYVEEKETPPVALPEKRAAEFEEIGDTVTIVIHDDGRVGFTRLLGDLVPLAASLAATGDARVAARIPGCS